MMANKTKIEEITEFPEQSTFNKEDMSVIVDEEVEEDENKNN